MFWGGGISNQVETNEHVGSTNSQDIKELAKAMNDYFSDQRVENTKYITKEGFKRAEDYWDATDDNFACRVQDVHEVILSSPVAFFCSGSVVLGYEGLFLKVVFRFRIGCRYVFCAVARESTSSRT